MWVILVVGRCLRKKMIAMRRTPPRLANYLKTCASSILYSSLACNNETERERERAIRFGKWKVLCFVLFLCTRLQVRVPTRKLPGRDGFVTLIFSGQLINSTESTQCFFFFLSNYSTILFYFEDMFF